MTTKMTWKDLMRELLEQAQSSSDQGDSSGVTVISDEQQEQLQQALQEMADDLLGPDEEGFGMKAHVIAIDMNELGADFDELSDDEKLQRFESLINQQGRLRDVLETLQDGSPEEINTIAHNAQQRISDLMEADGLIEPRDIVQKALAKRAAADPLSVVQGPKTLQ